MKRIFGIVLIIALLITTFAAVPVFAASEMKVSDDLVRILKMEEGFVRYPQWDYGQYSIGYGTRCPDDMLEYYKENGITVGSRAAAAQLPDQYGKGSQYQADRQVWSDHDPRSV